MNAVQILGTMTRDTEIRYSQSGTAIASFGIAYNEKRKDAIGQYQDVTHFFDVTAFGRSAENINQYFRKGSRILINGSLDFQSWTSQDGAKKSKVGIKLNQFDFIDRKDSNNQSQPHQESPQTPAPNQGHSQAPQNGYSQPTQNQQGTTPSTPEIDINEDEIPF